MQVTISNADFASKRPKSITPSGFFGSSEDQIFELKDCVTQEELTLLNNFALNNTIWDVTESHYNEDGVCIYDASVWENRVAGYYSLLKADPKILAIVQDVIARIKPHIEKFYNVKVEVTGPSVVRWPVGTRQVPHADKELHEGPSAGQPNDFPHYDIGTVVYLNNDYEGGELYFPMQGIEFKPKTGAAYWFPGDKNYIHGVRPILSGNRFTLPFFWTITEHGESNG